MFSLAWSCDEGDAQAVATDILDMPEVAPRTSFLAPKNENPPRVFPHRRWPVRHSDHTSDDLGKWSLRIFGSVDDELEIYYSDLPALPAAQTLMDTSLTSYRYRAKEWCGADLVALLGLAGVRGDADWLVAHSEGGYSTMVPLDRVFEGHPVLAWQVEGRPLTNREGGPLRLLLPHCESRLSAKWVRGLELRSELPG